MALTEIPKNIFKLEDIREKPTTFNNVHESIYRAYDTLNLVLEMVARGDSKETIFMVANDLGLHQKDEKSK